MTNYIEVGILIAEEQGITVDVLIIRRAADQSKQGTGLPIPAEWRDLSQFGLWTVWGLRKSFRRKNTLSGSHHESVL